MRRWAASRRFFADLLAHPAAEKRASRKRPRQAAPARDKIRAGFQLTPARGRKLVFWMTAIHPTDFNSPPHGDGNTYGHHNRLIVQFQLTPARGRKPAVSAVPLTTIRFQLTPARGRKRNPSSVISSVVVFQLTPARGRKPIGMKYKDVMPIISTHPRTGTVTRKEITRIRPHAISTHPRAGTVTDGRHKGKKF